MWDSLYSFLISYLTFKNSLWGEAIYMRNVGEPLVLHALLNVLKFHLREAYAYKLMTKIKNINK